MKKNGVRSLRLMIGLAAVVAASAASAETRLICRLAPTANPAAIATKYGVVLRDVTAPAPFALYGVANAREADRVQRKMSRDALILWAEDDASLSAPENQGGRGTVIPAIGGRADLQSMNTGLLQQIRFDQTLADLAGREVRIAVLDTGVASTHTYLWSKTVASINAIEPGQPAYDQPMLQDSNGNGRRDEAVGHGTMVAALTDLVGPQTKLIVGRVADSDGNATAWTVIKGIAFAGTNGAEVVNISLGSVDKIAALSDVMDWCEEKNIVVVAPIGNDNRRLALNPSNISKVICVAGLSADDRKAPFSNWEGTCDASAPAVGSAVRRPDGTYDVWSGTSFASPLVAGALADCLRRSPRRDEGDIRKIVTSSGDSINAFNSAYKDRLGTRLNYFRLDSMLRNAGP